MKYIDTIDTIFRNYNIKKICKQYHIKNYSINKDGSIDVSDNVYTFTLRKDLIKIPIKFNRVDGDFSCAGCNLTTLENSPNYVGRRFSCDHNNLTTLIGGPARIGLSQWDNYNCQNNNLKDVYGFPSSNSIGGIFIENNPVNEIITLTPYMNGKIKFIYWLNEFNVIRNGDTIVEDRLEEALEKINLRWESIKKYSKFKNYRLI